MTVVGYTGKGQAECCWFDDDKKQHRIKFPESALHETPVAELSDEQLRSCVHATLVRRECKRGQPNKTK